MANRFMILLLCSIIDILLLRQIHVAAQQIKTVLAGEAVEFSCSLTETLPAGDVSWQIQWDSSNTPVLVNAETTASLYDSIFNTGHGDFRTVYRSEKVFRFTHYCTLIIENVQLDDAGIYNCKHVGNYRDRGIFSEHELRVLPRPPDSALPRCSHSVITPSSSPQNNIIQLSCQFSGGNPPAQLVWYKEGMRIGEIRENTNIMEYQLRPFDNGVEFSCHAMSPALSETSYCHVMPLEIYPSVMLLPASVMATSGAYVRFTCSGQGLPSIDRIDWYVDGVLQSGSSRGAVQANLKTSNSSFLTLNDLQEDENGMDVMCEVVLPSGLTANSLTRIAMITGPTATVMVSHPPSNRPTIVQTTAQVTKAGSTKRSDETKTTSAKSGPKTKTTHTLTRELQFLMVSLITAGRILHKRNNHLLLL
ncbi:basigin-like [Amphiura filiformis]|uniref:basigin-like n=1 Tax=Amphiura filiformis TaxID=82378 RepID=UPI003B21E413